MLLYCRAFNVVLARVIIVFLSLLYRACYLCSPLNVHLGRISSKMTTQNDGRNIVFSFLLFAVWNSLENPKEECVNGNSSVSIFSIDI